MTDETKSRPRGNKSSKARIAALTPVAITLSASKTQAEIGKELGVCERTVRNYLAEAPAEQMVQEDLDDLQSLWDEVTSRRKAGQPLTLSCIDRLARLLELRIKLRGTAAPTRSESVNVNVDADPQKLGPYQRFCYETRGLGMEDMGPVWELLARLRAEKEPEPMPQPPKDSPLWHPKTKELMP